MLMRSIFGKLGVVPTARGSGLAGRLLQAVAETGLSLGCTKLQVGIEPSNGPSLGLMRSFARNMNVELREVGRIDFDDEISGVSEYDTVWEMPLIGKR